ncbi:PTS system [Cutibacterium acnes JCM 18909]|nr:PTS system [Cutibacterium acnes JCM 18909]
MLRPTARRIPGRHDHAEYRSFIAWGLLTALFIETGWAPNATLAKLVNPTLTYLLPVLIGYTGGKIVNGTRGGVIGAIATMGVIVAPTSPCSLARW